MDVQARTFTNKGVVVFTLKRLELASIYGVKEQWQLWGKADSLCDAPLSLMHTLILLQISQRESLVFDRWLRFVYSFW